VVSEASDSVTLAPAAVLLAIVKVTPGTTSFTVLLALSTLTPFN